MARRTPKPTVSVTVTAQRELLSIWEVKGKNATQVASFCLTVILIYAIFGHNQERK
jgi:hypothetical protein